MNWTVVILRGEGGEEGPFTEEEVLDLLDSGELTRDDWCRVDGAPHAQRIGELFLTIDPVALPAPTEGDAAAADAFPFPDLAGPPDQDGSCGSGDAAESCTRIAHSSTDDEDDQDPERAAPPPADSHFAGDEFADEFGESDEEAPDDDDVILYLGCPSWLNSWPTFALMAVVLAVGYWAGAMAGWWLGAAFGLSFLLLARAFIGRARLEFRVTRDRVEMIEGLVAKTSREIRIEDIRAINVAEHGLPGLFGVGTISFSSVGGPEDDVVFFGVRGAHRLKGFVRELQRGGTGSWAQR